MCSSDLCSPIIVLEIDDRATRYNSFMEKFGYVPQQHLIYDSGPMVFVNTVYVRDKIGSLAQSVEQ